MKVSKFIRYTSGFTLVELLIAMTLGVFMMAGVLAVFISSKQSYAQQDALGQMQENARFALEMLSRETRMAGFGGCSNEISVANTLTGTIGEVATFSRGLTGYLGSDTNSTFPAAFQGASEPNTDAIVIHTVDNDSALIVSGHNPSSANIPFNTSDSTLKTGDIVVMVDNNCSNMAIFANTGPTNNSNNAGESVHNTGNITGFSYQNCDNRLKGSFTCTDTSSALTLAYSNGSSVYKMDSFAYYIGTSSADSSILSLYREDLSGSTGAREMVEGITDLEMYYGLKTGNNVQYFKADGISAANWVNVQSVRYNVTVRSLSSVNGNPVSQNFSTTVKLRNRG
jgi:type IV pilus assembly protein PilW